ncbi:MAG: cyclic nucleotide-binding domain-containing protein [Gammaproteobacteria bacterium]
MDFEKRLMFTWSSPLAKELSERDSERLAEVTRYRVLNDGEVLIQDGELDNSLYVVVSGALSVEKLDDDGAVHQLYLIEEGKLAGELGFVDGNEHTATLRAKGQTEVLTLGREPFETLLDTNPQIVYYVMRAIVRSSHAIVRRMNIEHVKMEQALNGA